MTMLPDYTTCPQCGKTVVMQCPACLRALIGGEATILQAENAAFKARIAALEGYMNAADDRIAELEKAGGAVLRLLCKLLWKERE